MRKPTSHIVFVLSCYHQSWARGRKRKRRSEKSCADVTMRPCMCTKGGHLNTTILTRTQTRARKGGHYTDLLQTSKGVSMLLRRNTSASAYFCKWGDGWDETRGHEIFIPQGPSGCPSQLTLELSMFRISQ